MNFYRDLKELRIPDLRGSALKYKSDSIGPFITVNSILSHLALPMLRIHLCNVQALAIALETSSTLLPAVEAVPVPVEVSFAVDSSLKSSISIDG